MGQKVLQLLICLCFHHILGHTVLLLLSAHGFSLYKDPLASVGDRVEDLLSLMTLEEKLGQMVQIDCTVANASVIQHFFVGMLCIYISKGKTWKILLRIYFISPNATPLSLWFLLLRR